VTTRRDPSEGVELEDDVHQLEQMLLGADGKEFYVHARVKAWLLFFALGIGFFVVKGLLLRIGFDPIFDPAFALILTVAVMKYVTPEVPLEAHAASLYNEVRRLALGVARGRRTGGATVAPYSLLPKASRRPWARLRQQRNRTDG
jgi:hypothetical protein